MNQFINESLLAAVESGDAAKVKELLTEDGKVIATSFHGYKSIVCAAETGRTEILKMLLDSNAKANRESFWSNSHHTASVALKYASCNGNAEAVKLLLEYGAGAVVNDFTEAVICAAEKGHTEILKMLLDSNAKTKWKIFWSKGTAYNALRKGNTKVVKILLEYKANADKSNLNGALIEALVSRNLELMQILLKAGADVNIKDDNGMTPLIYAILFPDEKQEIIVEAMLAAGADVNTKDKNRCSALMYAEKAGNAKIVEMLRKVEKIVKKN
jgi:ankyrin repeat protein